MRYEDNAQICSRLRLRQSAVGHNVVRVVIGNSVVCDLITAKYGHIAVDTTTGPLVVDHSKVEMSGRPSRISSLANTANFLASTNGLAILNTVRIQMRINAVDRLGVSILIFNSVVLNQNVVTICILPANRDNLTTGKGINIVVSIGHIIHTSMILQGTAPVTGLNTPLCVILVEILHGMFKRINA